MLHVYNHYIIYCIYKCKQCTVIYISYATYINVIIKSWFQQRKNTPFVHSTILGARQGATLSSHAFLELPRLPWPYVVMTCVDRVRPMVPVWFFEQVMMKEATSWYFSRLGMIGFRNVIQIWFGRLLCRFLLVWWLWFVDWLTDCFIGCKIALLDRISSHLPKEHDINRYETRKKITRHVLKRHVVIKNQPVRHVHQKATALEQKITFRIPFGLHPTRSAGCRPNVSVVGGSNLDSSPPSTRWIRWFHNRLKIAENCGGIPNPCHLNHNFIWQFNHALLKWSIYKSWST